jgi:transcriptional regulator with XRE-family HTH domain
VPGWLTKTSQNSYFEEMSSSKWVDSGFGQRLKAERERRGWTQPQMADMLSDKGIRPMHPTTVAKIEAGDRSVRINEAVGIADLFQVSVDSLLGRKPWAQRNELAYSLRVLGDTARDSSEQVGATMETIREQLEELPGDFDGADVLQRIGRDTWETCLPAANALFRLEIFSAKLLLREQGRPELSEEALMELGVPEDEAPS